MTRRPTTIETKFAVKQRKREDTVRELLSSQHGREFLWWLMEEAHVEAREFAPEPYVMFFRAGRRDAGLALQSLIRSADIGLYATMLQEALAERPARPETDDEEGEGGD